MNGIFSGIDFNIITPNVSGVASGKSYDASGAFENVLATMMAQANVSHVSNEPLQEFDVKEKLAQIIKNLLGNSESTEKIIKQFLDMNEKFSTSVSNIVENLNEIVFIVKGNNDKYDENVFQICCDNDDKADENALIQAVSQILQRVSELVNEYSKGSEQAAKSVNIISEAVSMIKDMVDDAQHSQVIGNESTQQIGKEFNVTKLLCDALKSIDSNVSKPQENIKINVNDFQSNTQKVANTLQLSDMKNELSSVATQTLNIKDQKQKSELDDILGITSTVPIKASDADVAKITDINKTITENITQQIKSQLVNEINTIDGKEAIKKLSFTLTPESLGKVNVLLIKDNDSLVVSIMAKEASTQKLIAQNIDSLSLALAGVNSNVKQVILIESPEKAAMYFGTQQGNGFNMSQDSRSFNNQAMQQRSYNHNIKESADDSVYQNSIQNDIYERSSLFWQTA